VYKRKQLDIFIQFIHLTYLLRKLGAVDDTDIAPVNWDTWRRNIAEEWRINGR
jgi:hypothetical protein